MRTSLTSLTFLLILCTFSLSAQLNVEYAGDVKYDHRINDIWGYESPEGIEYALVGSEKGFSIVSLEVPTEPREEHFIPGKMSTWRDVKTWDHYAYVCTDNANQGILIVDLNTIDNDTVTWQIYSPQIPEHGTLLDAHNIYIDENGWLYLAGSNLNNGGIILLDITVDPWAPAFAGIASTTYAHDVYARDHIMYASEIYQGELVLYDVTDPMGSKFLGSTETPSLFTHNAWPSDDATVAFTTDERANAWIGSYDLTDYDNIKELDRFKPAVSAGNGVIPHNVHVLNDYLIISYYSDGVIIVDAARPDNLIEVGNYDTFLGGHGGFNGAWGAYPFLPSGTALVTDRSNGLFILTPTYVRGCYLEGTVKDANSLEAIFQAEVQILGEEVVLPEVTNLEGAFKTGKAISGTYLVSVSAAGYHTLTEEVGFENGVIVEKEFLLEPKDKFEVNGVVRSSTQQAPAPNAFVFIQDADFRHEVTADESGNFSLSDVYEGEYTVYAGTWGEYFIGTIEIDGAGEDEITIAPGYYDDFNFEFDWTVSGNTSRGQWIKADPNRQLLFNFYPCNPGEDVEGDFGEAAFVTGNMGNDAAMDDVDNGFTLLSSPLMELTKFDDPLLTFQPWLCQLFEEVTTYTVLLSNGTDTVTIDTVERLDLEGSWQSVYEHHLENYLEITDAMQVHFMVTDTVVSGTENVVKAGLDVFTVTGELSSGIDDPLYNNPAVFVNPNPFSNGFEVRVSEESFKGEFKYQFYDALGRLVANGVMSEATEWIRPAGDLQNGLYILRLLQDGRPFSSSKLLKQVAK